MRIGVDSRAIGRHCRRLEAKADVLILPKGVSAQDHLSDGCSRLVYQLDSGPKYVRIILRNVIVGVSDSRGAAVVAEKHIRNHLPVDPIDALVVGIRLPNKVHFDISN